MASILWYHFVFAPSQWETTLQCNVVSHWLGAYTEWSLDPVDELRLMSWKTHLYWWAIVIHIESTLLTSKKEIGHRQIPRWIHSCACQYNTYPGNDFSVKITRSCWQQCLWASDGSFQGHNYSWIVWYHQENTPLENVFGYVCRGLLFQVGVNTIRYYFNNESSCRNPMIQDIPVVCV